MVENTDYDIEEKTYVQRFLGFFSRSKDSLDELVEEENLSTREHLARLETGLFEMTKTYRLLERERLTEIETIKTKLAEQTEEAESLIIVLKESIQKEDELMNYIFSRFDEGISDNQIIEELIEQGNKVNYLKHRTGEILINVDWINYKD